MMRPVRRSGTRTEPKSGAGSILAVVHPGSRHDRIIEAMRTSSSPLDDDQLADRTAISPRQSVNQVCRELERVGTVALTARSSTNGSVTTTGSQMAPRAPLVPTLTRPPWLPKPVPSGLATSCRRAARVSSATLSGSCWTCLASNWAGRELNPATLTMPSGERV